MSFAQSLFKLIVLSAAKRSTSAVELEGIIQGLTAAVRSMNFGATFHEVYRVSMLAKDSRKSIKNKAVSCLECGKDFRIITAKHLASHCLTKWQYLDKYGMDMDTTLVAKDLSRERSLAMMERKLWKRPVRDNEHEK